MWHLEFELVGRQDRHAFAAGLDCDGPHDAQITARTPIGPDACFPYQVDEWSAAAVEDRHFQVVEFDIGVVDTHAIEDAEQMLGCGDEDATAHQAGGVAHSLYKAPAGGDLEALQICADEYNARGGGRRRDPQINRCSMVKTNSTDFDRLADRGFVTHFMTPIAYQAAGSLCNRLSRKNFKEM